MKATNGDVDMEEPAETSVVDTTVEEMNVSNVSNVSEQSVNAKPTPKPRGRGRGRGRGNWAKRGYNRT